MLNTSKGIPKPSLESMVDSYLTLKHDRKAENAISNILMAILYAFLLLFISYKQVPLSGFRIAETVRNGFIKDLSKISKIKDVEKWANKSFLPSMFDNEDYNGKALHWRDRRQSCFNRNMHRIGSIRWRQLRVSSEPCNQLEDVIKNCSFDLNSDNMDKNSFNFKKLPSKARDQREFIETNDILIVANRHSYPSGGYIFEHNTPILPSNNWLDARTRAIIIESTLFNPNSNLFVHVTIVIEQSMDLSINIWNRIGIIDLYPYNSQYDIFILICQMVFVLLIIYDFCQNIRKIKILKIEFFTNLWNLTNLINNILGFSGIGLFITKLIQRNKVKDSLKDEFVNMQHLVIVNESFTYILAFMTSISCLRVLYILQFSRTIILLYRTIVLSSKPLKSILLIFSVSLLAHAHFAYLMFVTYMKSFSAMISSIYTICLATLSSPIMKELDKYNAPYRHIFYCSFVLINIVVCLNFLMAILNEAHLQAKMEKSKTKVHILRYLKKKFNENAQELRQTLTVEKEKEKLK